MRKYIVKCSINSHLQRFGSLGLHIAVNVRASRYPAFEYKHNQPHYEHKQPNRDEWFPFFKVLPVAVVVVAG